MGGQQQLLIAELQQSEMRRFDGVQNIYEKETRNPIGLRSANIERAFNVVAAQKFIGWPFDEPFDAFLLRACAVVRDYIAGPYIADLRPEYRAKMESARKSTSWFDYVQRGLFLAFVGKDEKTLTTISNWVAFDMQEDSGVAEVAPAINVLHEHICCLIRGEEIPTNFADRFDAGIKKDHDRLLGDMLLAIPSERHTQFLAALNAFVKAWRGNTKHADFDEIISVEASILCCLWRRLVGTELGAPVQARCIFDATDVS